MHQYIPVINGFVMYAVLVGPRCQFLRQFSCVALKLDIDTLGKPVVARSCQKLYLASSFRAPRDSTKIWSFNDSVSTAAVKVQPD